jgi:hypothetical protein
MYKTITRGSLEEKYPDIAVEWDKEKNGTLTPSMFLPGSDYKAYWRCKKCNCVWQTTIAHRVEGTGCPQCYMNDTERDAYKRKAILQCDLEGNVIKEWVSISEAARQLGLSVGNISSVLQCKRNQCGGYIWKYRGEGGT